VQETHRTQAGQHQSVRLRLRDGRDFQANHDVVVVAVDAHAVIESKDQVVRAAEGKRREHGASKRAQDRVGREVAEVLAVADGSSLEQVGERKVQRTRRDRTRDGRVERPLVAQRAAAQAKDEGVGAMRPGQSPSRICTKWAPSPNRSNAN